MNSNVLGGIFKLWMEFLGCYAWLKLIDRTYRCRAQGFAQSEPCERAINHRGTGPNIQKGDCSGCGWGDIGVCRHAQGDWRTAERGEFGRFEQLSCRIGRMLFFVFFLKLVLTILPALNEFISIFKPIEVIQIEQSKMSAKTKERFIRLAVEYNSYAST